MCLAIPGKIIEIYEKDSLRMAKVDFGGVIREACLEALPEAKTGEYVIVHAGFALNTLTEEEAQETLSIFKEMDRLEQQSPDNE
jgi:hydrogenase expression/formation protein HypC